MGLKKKRFQFGYVKNQSTINNQICYRSRLITNLEVVVDIEVAVDLKLLLIFFDIIRSQSCIVVGEVVFSDLSLLYFFGSLL